MIARFLTLCAAFSWIFDTSMVSILLFGEYPYPTEESDT